MERVSGPAESRLTSDRMSIEPSERSRLEVADIEHTVRVGRPVYGGMSTVDLPGGAELPFAIAGELVRVSLAGAARRGVASLLEVLEPSPDRVASGCLHFGTCGGCQYQHLSQAAQLETKAAVLDDLLRRAGVSAPAVEIDAAAPWAYRNRVRFRVQDGRIGYSQRASHLFLPVEECPIVAPILLRAAKAAEALAAWPQRTAEVEFFATGDESQLQFALHVDADVHTLDRDAPTAFRALCTTLQSQIPALIGGGLLVQAATDPNASRRVQERQRVEVARWGVPGMVYHVDGRAYPVSRGAFFQVNRFLTDRLVQRVVGGRQGALAMDLFAGAGLFSLALAERFARVISVEIGEPAATDLAQLMAGHTTARQTTLTLLRQWNRGNTVPDLVVLDPPRAGVGDAVLSELRRLHAPEIVYVSCDPVSFAREARALVDSGYAVAELHALDLFPQTFHMETVAVFRRT